MSLLAEDAHQGAEWGEFAKGEEERKKIRGAP